ncbi:Desiccation-related protein pcc13-62 [Thalictrum thalictroides]|uniref:Desiccation-related protein pcc13-62 n=1 Tax=Thalictrum thalictroides TaxID=46969 RepID=A0A7J6W5V8_THATH|nr:Desiccation-related protein pcc13-62 [Thalictrum thalictroides]
MARNSPSSLLLFTFFFFFFFTSSSYGYFNVSSSDKVLLEFPLNLEYLEAEFFLWGSFGYGLDRIAPYLANGGPPPIGVTKANLDPFVKDIMVQFAFQEVGHLRAIKEAVPGFPRPLIDLSKGSFAKVMDEAVGHTLNPPFDPYANGLNFLLASYVIPYVGLTGYVGASPKLTHSQSRRLVAGLLSVESAQDAIIRALLYERANVKVQPYGLTVAEFTNRISELRNRLGNSGIKDEGLVVPLLSGAEGKTGGNIVVGNDKSIAFERTPKEILRIVYGSGDERKPGGFYPKGGDGQIAKSYLQQSTY